MKELCPDALMWGRRWGTFGKDPEGVSQSYKKILSFSFRPVCSTLTVGVIIPVKSINTTPVVPYNRIFEL